MTLDGKYLYNGSVYKPAKVPAVKKFSEDNDRIYFTAVLANLPKERYKNDYAARAYAEITRTVTEDDGKKKTTTETIEGAVVEFGTKSNDKVSTKYITMQSLIDQMKANPGGTYTLEHDIDASMVQGDDYLVPTFSGTFNGNGYKIKV